MREVRVCGCKWGREVQPGRKLGAWALRKGLRSSPTARVPSFLQAALPHTHLPVPLPPPPPPPRHCSHRPDLPRAFVPAPAQGEKGLIVLPAATAAPETRKNAQPVGAQGGGLLWGLRWIPVSRLPGWRSFPVQLPPGLLQGGQPPSGKGKLGTRGGAGPCRGRGCCRPLRAQAISGPPVGLWPLLTSWWLPLSLQMACHRGRPLTALDGSPQRECPQPPGPCSTDPGCI